MKELVKQFQESMSRISDEEFLKVWDELKEFNEIGPIASEYVEQVLSKINNFQITQTMIKGNYTLPERFKMFLIHKAKNYQLFKDNLKYFTDCSIDEYLEFTHPEDYISNAFDFTLAMRPYPNYWEDVESEWFEVLNRIINNK